MDPLRYVVLRHEGVEEPHYDLMFETAPGSALATWRVPDWPLRPGSRTTPLEGHRPSYLTYEGELSDNRGWVRRVHSGTHTVRSDHDVYLAVTLEDGTALRLYRRFPAVALVIAPGA